MSNARFHIPDVTGRTYAVFGLARSGMAAAKVLAANGARVWAWDDNNASHGKAAEAGIPLVDLHHCDWAEVSELVLSPGIPHTHPKPHPVAVLAKQHDCAIIGDMELLARADTGARFVGITGTNGKSTTTSLIGHILKQAGLSTEVGGNLGTSALDLQPLDARGVYVLEASSYQLELMPSMVFDVAVLLNITPDHLDRHGGMDGYVAAKLRIFERQTPKQAADHRHRRRALPQHPQEDRRSEAAARHSDFRREPRRRRRLCRSRQADRRHCRRRPRRHDPGRRAAPARPA